MKKNLTIIILVLFTTLLGSYAYIECHQPLNRSVLRLHVVANSDSPADQALKLQIKDQIVTQMGEEFKDVNSAQEARRIAISKQAEIKAVAESIITSRGYNYPVEVYVGEFEFPTKSYGNLVFPQGRYEAVRVV
jgi:stage II sporulation protein R